MKKQLAEIHSLTQSAPSNVVMSAQPEREVQLETRQQRTEKVRGWKFVLAGAMAGSYLGVVVCIIQTRLSATDEVGTLVAPFLPLLILIAAALYGLMGTVGGGLLGLLCYGIYYGITRVLECRLPRTVTAPSEIEK